MRKVLLPLVFLGIGFSYGVFVGLYQVFPFEQIRAIKHFLLSDSSQIINSIRNKEYRISIFEAFSPQADIVFIGDSITQGGEWSEFFPNLFVLNRGVGGDKASDILRRLDSIYSAKPKNAFLMVGINDIYRSVSVDEIVENYIALVEKLRAKDITVFIQSTIQCEAIKCLDKIEKVNELNSRLKTYANENEIPFVDLGVLSSSKGLDASFTYDGVHLNGKGYKVWVNILTPIFQ